ncbi:MAG: MFS transporter [Candidatus Hydrogenedentes bacterium]|nr:MFS transporter [Candidatus Hydrogenedentota bacterium]
MSQPSSVSSSPSLSWEAQQWRIKILVATYIAYVGYYLTRKTFTIAKTTIANEFGWGLDATGHIWATFLFAYMVGQFLSSYVGRRYGPRVLLLGGLGISIMINAVFGFIGAFNVFLLFMFLNGLMQATGWPGCVGGVSRWLRPAERGSIMGVWSTNYLIGNMVVKGLGGVILGPAGLCYLLPSLTFLSYIQGWRWAFWAMAILSIAIWCIVFFWQRDKPEDVGLASIVEEKTAETEDRRTVRAAEAEHLRFREYLMLALNPAIVTMGMSYFCIKFLRYALDSWLPAFLNIKGLDVANASFYSSVFDMAGLAGAIVAGIALDRVFKGNWAALCFTLGLMMIASYGAVIVFGTTPGAIALCYGLVGFSLYGPDTILAGAAAVQVAGEKNGVAVAGVVNGIASLGPVIQEEVIAWFVKGDPLAGMHNANIMALAMSITFACLMVYMMWRYHVIHKGFRDAAADRSTP